MRRFLIIPLIGILAALGLGSAAALGEITSPNVAASDANVDSCDPNGVIVTYATAYSPSLATFVVNSATISDIHAQCAGYDMTVALTAEDNSLIQSRTSNNIVPTS